MAKKRKTYWLSYDLGVGGDYDHLYQWLDDHNAKPCGNSVAYFNYEYDDDKNPDEILEEELNAKINLLPGNKLYIIRKKEDNSKITGSFIYGKRGATPWEGYGKSVSEEEDE